MTGKFINRDRGEDTDIEALNAGYASVVPVRIDFTDDKLKSWMEKKFPDFT
jgi:5'-nucleotidase